MKIDFSQIGPVSVGREINFLTTDGGCRQNTLSHDTFVHVQLITARTAQIFHSRNTRGSSRLPWCAKSSLSSQRRVSHVASLATEHFYTISLTFLNCLPTFFSLTVLSFRIGPRNPARFTAETTHPCMRPASLPPYGSLALQSQPRDLQECNAKGLQLFAHSESSKKQPVVNVSSMRMCGCGQRCASVISLSCENSSSSQVHLTSVSSQILSWACRKYAGRHRLQASYYVKNNRPVQSRSSTLQQTWICRTR